MEGEKHLEKSRIKELYKKDAFLKIFSIFIAIILWSYVSFVLDPETEKELTNIPVKFVNEQALTNTGMTLINSEYTVDFIVKGRRNVVNAINKDRVFAEADLAGLSKLGRNKISVKIEGLSSMIQIIKEPEDIFIDLDKLYSVQKTISVITKGETQKGYAVNNPSVNPASVKIEGSQKLINSIYEVNVAVDITNLDNTFNAKEEINIVDNKGETIKGLKCNINYVEVKVPIVRAKEVQLKPIIKGTAAKNSHVGTITINPPKVFITGNDDVLNRINEFSLEPVDIKGASSDVVKKVKIITVSGVALVNNNGYAEVTVDINKEGTKDILLTSASIEINDKKQDYDYKILKDKIQITIEGIEDDLKDINPNLIVGSVNVKNLDEGDYSIPMLLNLPGNIKQSSAVLVPVRVSRK